MKAAINTWYGGPEVVRLAETEAPRPKPDEILVRVNAAGVTTADWRLRAAAFPGVMQIPGRLMFGMFRPRNPVLGSDFAGSVTEVGANVSDFAPGDRVFGFSSGGAHAEYLTIKAGGAVLRIPADLADSDAAALPFGGLCALAFLEQYGEVRRGERVLIVGASGGVGSYAVQIAKALGAEVIGVASGANAEFVHGLGADGFVDYRTTDIRALGTSYDVIFDTIGVLDYPAAASQLRVNGRFVPLNFGTGDFLHLRRARRAGHRIVLQVNRDTKTGLARLVDLMAAGKLRPIVDRVYRFADIRGAYEHVESRHRKGAVVLAVAE